jgi:serine phosphatase RsbU (regulator of sigma subunit)/tetratricopeptide (TPR) repeat protein
MAEELGDKSTIASGLLWQGFIAELRGDHREASSAMTRAKVEFGNWFDAKEYAMVRACLAWDYSIRGHLREAKLNLLECIDRSVFESGSEIDRSGPPNHVYLAQIYYMEGDTSEALKHIEKEGIELLNATPQYMTGSPDVLYRNAAALAAAVHIMTELGDLGEALEEKIEFYHRHGAKPRGPLFRRQFYIYQGHARLAQVLAARAEKKDLAAPISKFKEALKQLRLAATVPAFEGHYHLLMAYFHYFHGRHAAATRALNKADSIADEIDHPWVSQETACARARFLKDRGKMEAAYRHAKETLTLCHEMGWNARFKKLSVEFDGVDRELSIRTHAPSASSSMTASLLPKSVAAPSATQMIDYQVRHSQRKVEALLKLSQESSKVIDPEHGAHVALDQIIELLNAERAFLFLNGPKGLEFRCGRTARKENVSAPTGFSTTIVHKVFKSGKAYTHSGLDESAANASQSIVLHKLNSVMAAPLRLRDEVIGVAYLDSTIAKGIFTDKDTDILEALASHIAAMLETARASRLETENQVMAKNLEVTGMVQSLLLPPAPNYHDNLMALESFYRSASESGGDWWWHQVDPEKGTLKVVLGDVTGHGVGSAMMAAFVAGAYRASERNRKDGSFVEIFETVDKLMHANGDGNYWMSALGIEIDPARGTIDVWTAGAPPFFILRQDGAVELVMGKQGMPLGAGESNFPLDSRKIAPGDRILLFTDGVYEFKVGERMFSLKGLRGLLLETRGMDIDAAKKHLYETLNRLNPKERQDDDSTFVLIDILKPKA